jgi:hypothetical protein
MATSKSADGSADIGTVTLRKLVSFLDGEVVAPTGQPLPGATVRGWKQKRNRIIFLKRDLSSENFEIKTDSSGRFRLEMSFRDEVVIQAEMEGYGPSMSRTVWPVSGEDQNIRLELTKQPAQGSLQGTVKLRSVPAARVRVSVAGWNTSRSMITGSDGRFHFDKVTPGRLFVSAVDCQGHRGTTAVLLDPGDDFTFDIFLPHDRQTSPISWDWCVR